MLCNGTYNGARNYCDARAAYALGCHNVGNEPLLTTEVPGLSRSTDGRQLNLGCVVVT